jgi:SAM-dependent methyltransferase
MTKTLDLGSGPNPNNPYNADDVFGIDIRDDLGDKIVSADLVIGAIPFDSDLFDYVTAFQFIEHVPRVIYNPEKRNPFIELMNEIYRVLKTGGIFLSVTPAYPHGAAFQDPTHVNIITEETFIKYFDDTYRWAKMYGFNGSFKIIRQEWSGANLITQLQKV